MIYNYHTHTPRCNHASGTPEEYINRAIAGGMQQLGFSDHAPSMFTAAAKINSRMQLQEAPDYVAELQTLLKKYSDRIDLKIGFEMEYYPHHFADMLDTVKALGIEYLILGQHYCYEEGPGCHFVGTPSDDIKELHAHVDEVVAAIRSGVFTYVAHPDVFRFTGDTACYLEEMHRICAASNECGIPLEINFYGIRDRRHYPNELFWQMVGREGCRVVFGCDAHTTDTVCDTASLEIAREMVKKYRLNYIGAPTPILLQNTK